MRVRLLSVAQWTLSDIRRSHLTSASMQILERAAVRSSHSHVSASHILMLRLVLQSYAVVTVTRFTTQADANFVGLLAQILNVSLLRLNTLQDLFAATNPRGSTLLRRLLNHTLNAHVH